MGVPSVISVSVLLLRRQSGLLSHAIAPIEHATIYAERRTQLVSPATNYILDHPLLV
jgi:hypothetical protein